jgi:hypothetical protein
MADGFGEVELHYHHANDSSETLRVALKYAIARFQAFGFLKTVDGRTAFAFVHGVSSIEDEDEVVGEHFENALTELEQHYNDGQRYVLHYVTAREAYNLAMAAASGATGSPSAYMDSEIPPYVASAPRTVELAATERGLRFRCGTVHPFVRGPNTRRGYMRRLIDIRGGPGATMLAMHAYARRRRRRPRSRPSTARR